MQWIAHFCAFAKANAICKWLKNLPLRHFSSNHEPWNCFGKHWIFGGKGRESLDNPQGVRLRLDKEWLLPTINLSQSPTSWKQVSKLTSLLPGPSQYRRVSSLTQYVPQYCAEKKSNCTCVSSSNFSLVLQYLLCSRFPACPCHHPHPSHLSPCKLSCQKATRLAYACLLDSVVSGER